MDIYVTTTSMLDHDDVKKLFAAKTRKECSLYVYCENDVKLAISEVQELLSASKKFNIEFFEIAGENDFVFSIGLLMGKLGAKSQIYTILPPEYELSETMQEQYGLKRYEPSGVTVSRQKIQRKRKSVVSQESSKPDQNEPASPDSKFEEPLFFSGDSEKFFYNQLNLLPEEIESSKSRDEIGRLVAECMKLANGDEQLLRFQLKQSFGEYADIIIEHIEKKRDLLKDCLFIKQ